MMAVRASLAQIAENSLGKLHTIACVNDPSDTVLSDTKEEMNEIAELLEAAGYRCIKLNVAFAFHSEQTDPILNEFEAVAKTSVLFQEPKLSVISPLLGKVVFDNKSLNANYVRRATREAVDFLSALRMLGRSPSLAMRLFGWKWGHILSAMASPKPSFRPLGSQFHQSAAATTTGKPCLRAWLLYNLLASKLAGTSSTTHLKADYASWICQLTPGTIRTTGCSTPAIGA